jgi:hypothetical protein
MAEVKTVDQLGIGPSARYARDQAALKGKVLQDAHIATRVEVAVVTPYRSTEFEKYATTNERATWASFSAPPDTSRSLPSWEATQTDKLETLIGTLPPEQERPLKALIKCGKKIDDLNQMSNRIVGCLGQYTKG